MNCGRIRAIGVGLCVLLVMGRICTHEFTWWDDASTLHQNPKLNPPTVSGIAWNWAYPSMDIYVPITYTTWGLLSYIAYLESPNEDGIHLNPWIFHAASVLVHAVTTIAVFLLLGRIFGRDAPAAFGAILFGIHPVQVETVAWASGMKDLLCGMFTILSLWQYHRFATGPRKSPAYALAVLFCLCAMLSKPTGMIVPAMIVILDRFVIGRPWRNVVRGAGPMIPLSIACALLAKLVQPGDGIETQPLWVRPFIAGDALAFYLWKILWPIHLAVDYGRRPQMVLAWPGVWAIWLAPATLALAIWINRKRAPSLLGASLFFLCGIAPVLGLTPFLFQFYSTTADHYLYPAMFGIALAGGWAIQRLPARAAALIGAAGIILLGIRSFDQAKHWYDDVTLWEHTVRVNPDSFAGHSSLGAALARRGDFGRAGTHLQRALQIKPDLAPAMDHYSKLLLLTGRTDEGIDRMRDYLRITDNFPARRRPDNTSGYWQLTQLYMQQQRWHDAAGALEQVLGRKPDHPQALEAAEQVRAKLGGGNP
jgi:protein O-mannosyl-transferase